MNGEEKLDFSEIDKKRVFIALLIFIVLVGAGGFWAKNNVPKFLAQKQIEDIAHTGSAEERLGSSDEGTKTGEVAGSSEQRFTVEDTKQDLQKQIDEIKDTIAKLKPEDIKEQAPVQKILGDLDELAKKASESAKIFDVKGNICEEAKKRFCE